MGYATFFVLAVILKAKILEDYFKLASIDFDSLFTISV